MKKIAVSYMPLLWLLSIPVLNVFYGILNRGDGQVRTLITPLDTATPFLPVFVVPYLIWYPFILAMFLLLFFQHRQAYYRSLFLLCLGLIACYLAYVAYQTTVPRPVLTPDTPFYALMHFVYSHDQPFNCFPSIHVMTTYVMHKHVMRFANLKPLLRVGIAVTSWSIIASTVFVKQHVVLDIFAAILLVECMIYVANKWFPIREARSVPALAGSEIPAFGSRPERQQAGPY